MPIVWAALLGTFSLIRSTAIHAAGIITGIAYEEEISDRFILSKEGK